MWVDSSRTIGFFFSVCGSYAPDLFISWRNLKVFGIRAFPHSRFAYRLVLVSVWNEGEGRRLYVRAMLRRIH